MAKQKLPSSFYDTRYAADVAEFTKLHNYDIPKNDDGIEPLKGVDVLNLNFARSFSDPVKLAHFKDNFEQFVGFKRFNIAKKYGFKTYAAFSDALVNGKVKNAQSARAEVEEFNKWWQLRREAINRLEKSVQKHYITPKKRRKLTAKAVGVATMITIGAGALVYNDLKKGHADFVNLETQRMIEQAMETLKADYAATYGMTEEQMDQFIADHLGTDMTAFEQELQAFQQWADGQREAWAANYGTTPFAQLKEYMDSQSTLMDRDDYIQQRQDKYDELINDALSQNGFSTLEEAQQYLTDNIEYYEDWTYYKTHTAAILEYNLKEAAEYMESTNAVLNDPDIIWPQPTTNTSVVQEFIDSLKPVEAEIDAKYEELLASYVPEDPTAEQLLAQDILQGFEGFQEQTIGDIPTQVAEQHDLSSYFDDHLGEIAMAALPGALIGASIRTAIPAIKTMKMRKMYKTVEKILAVENEKDALSESYSDKKGKPPKKSTPAKPDLTM